MPKNKKRARDVAGPSETARALPSGGQESEMPVIASLVAPMSIGEFFKDVWEERPKIFHNSFTSQTFSGRFGLQSVLDIADRLAADDMALAFGLDVNAARYKDGVRETPNREVADKATIKAMFRKELTTLQLHQPQRFNDDLASLMRSMEAELGCLVGCNAYLTPSGSQGLAPHHDDVELFVCQTKGSKRWRLYEPLEGFRLPSRPSGDLPEEVIGEPLMDIVLKEGDVLYMPRGIIHQAAAQEEDSVHLTISTYQNWTWGNLATTVLQNAGQSMQEPMCLPLAGRQSLPPGFLYQHSLEASCSTSAEVPTSDVNEHAASLASFFRAMADQVEASPELLTMAADTIALDFQRSRLAPKEEDLPPRGPEPGPGSCISARCNRGTFRIVPAEDTGGLMLLHCLGNDRMAHMMPDQAVDSDECSVDGNGSSEGESDDGKADGDSDAGNSSSGRSGSFHGDEGMIGPFDEDWIEAVTQVLSTCSKEPIPVASLAVQGHESQLAVARFLWSCGAATSYV